MGFLRRLVLQNSGARITRRLGRRPERINAATISHQGIDGYRPAPLSQRIVNAYLDTGQLPGQIECCANSTASGATDDAASQRIFPTRRAGRSPTAVFLPGSSCRRWSTLTNFSEGPSKKNRSLHSRPRLQREQQTIEHAQHPPELQPSDCGSNRRGHSASGARLEIGDGLIVKRELAHGRKEASCDVETKL